MSTHRPPRNDVERLENVLASWGTPDNDAYESEDELRAEAEAAGIDFAAWGAQVKRRVDTAAAASASQGASAPVAEKAPVRAKVARPVAPGRPARPRWPNRTSAAALGLAWAACLTLLLCYPTLLVYHDVKRRYWLVNAGQPEMGPDYTYVAMGASAAGLVLLVALLLLRRRSSRGPA